jgi:hypothetical protein
MITDVPKARCSLCAKTKVILAFRKDLFICDECVVESDRPFAMGDKMPFGSTK